VHLSSTAKGLREAMEEQLAELKQQRQGAAALAALWPISCAQLRAAPGLDLGAGRLTLTLTLWRTLGTLARCGSLPMLQQLRVSGTNDCRRQGRPEGDEGVALLGDGLRRGCLPSLQILRLTNAQIGPQGATALAPALTKRAMPSLVTLDLSNNQIGDAGFTALAPYLRQLPKLEQLNLYNNRIGDAGLITLAPALRQLPKLERLFLNKNQITHQGLAALLAPPTAGVLPSLLQLWLEDNQITEGCDALASALRMNPQYMDGMLRLYARGLKSAEYYQVI
jgi:hypothetical protein